MLANWFHDLFAAIRADDEKVITRFGQASRPLMDKQKAQLGTGLSLEAFNAGETSIVTLGGILAPNSNLARRPTATSQAADARGSTRT